MGHNAVKSLTLEANGKFTWNVLAFSAGTS